ncbi:hypothetical protein MHYP_G00293200 [Metynnis hypsauchen]
MDEAFCWERTASKFRWCDIKTVVMVTTNSQLHVQVGCQRKPLFETPVTRSALESQCAGTFAPVGLLFFPHSARQTKPRQTQSDPFQPGFTGATAAAERRAPAVGAVRSGREDCGISAALEGKGTTRFQNKELHVCFVFPAAFLPALLSTHTLSLQPEFGETRKQNREAPKAGTHSAADLYFARNFPPTEIAVRKRLGRGAVCQQSEGG